MPSPMNLAICPPICSSVVAQVDWNLRMTSARSSGSSSAASIVEPTRSQNITVRCRRSASVSVGLRALTDLSTEAPLPLKVRLAPQSPQNFVSAEFSLPQAGQRRGNAAPHCPQNLLPPGLMAPQLGHSIESHHLQ